MSINRTNKKIKYASTLIGALVLRNCKLSFFPQKSVAKNAKQVSVRAPSHITSHRSHACTLTCFALFSTVFQEKINCFQSVVLLTGTLECSSFLCSNFSQWGVAKNHYRYLILIPHQADLHSHTSWPALEVLTVHAEEKKIQHKTLSDTCSLAYNKQCHAYENFVKDIQPLRKCIGPQQHSWP